MVVLRFSPGTVVMMANQLKMADVQCILTLRDRGWSRRRIARELGLDRETVGRHLRFSAESVCDGGTAGSKPATSEGIALTGTTSQKTDGIESKPANADNALTGSGVNVEAGIAEVRRPAPGPPSRCEPWRALIAEKLQRRLSAQRIYQDLGFSGG